MPTATALVLTDRPERYLKQLVNHFGHPSKADKGVRTEFTATGGLLAFIMGRCDLAARDQGLELVATADDDARLEMLTDVVARHLVRFGAGEELAVTWRS